MGLWVKRMDSKRSMRQAEGSLSRPADIKGRPLGGTKKIISLFFFTNTDRVCALDLKSEKWSVIRGKGIEVACPMITEKNTGDEHIKSRDNAGTHTDTTNR